MNVVADALSRKPILSLLQMLNECKIQLATEYSKDQFYCEFLDGVRQNEEYKVHDDPIYYKQNNLLSAQICTKEEYFGICT